jgi:hypothetical protein
VRRFWFAARGLLAPLHVATHRYSQAEKLNRNPADDKQGAEAGLRKQNERRNGKEESSGHHQQSRKFHVSCLSECGAE